MKKLNLKKGTLQNYATYALVIVIYFAVQLLANGGYLTSSFKGMLVPICAYMIMAVSLNLTVGVLGELSLGHAGFMSVGAFTGTAAAIAMESSVPNTTLRLALALVIGALFAGLVGFLVGIPVLRLNGDYLAIVTLAFGEIIKSIFNNLYFGVDANGAHLSLINDKTNLLPDGKLIIAGPMGIGGIQKISTFLIAIILLLITLIVVFNLVKSRMGRAIMAIRDNRIAAESIGLNVTKYKMLAFSISASMAGAAGALFAMNFSTIVANKFDFNTSILILVFVVLGGLGNMLGSLIAAAALTILPEALREFSTYRMLVYAIVLILVMLATNNPQLKQFFGGLFKKKKKAEKEAQ